MKTKSIKKTISQAALLPLQNGFAETLRDILDEGDTAQIRIAEATGIPTPHLTQMKYGKRRCTPEYDLRLSKFYGISAGFFLRLQMAYELEKTRCEKADQIDSIKAKLVTA